MAVLTAAKALLIALANWAAYLDTRWRLEHDRHAASTNLESALFCALTGTLFGAADMSVLAGMAGTAELDWNRLVAARHTSPWAWLWRSAG